MFTGLIEEVGVVRRVVPAREGATLEIAAKQVMDRVRIGDSISVNGVCLTVTHFSGNTFFADAVPETMRRTNLGRLRPGAYVNLERALSVGDRFGGHIVSGHIDGVGQLESRTPEGAAMVLTVSASAGLLRYIAEKGSICVDGVSLTVMDVRPGAFRVSIIPHTGQSTTLLTTTVGADVNLECDVIAKYVERLLQSEPPGLAGGPAGGGVGLDFLRRNGFA